MEQRLTFDQVAKVYKAARPDYPETLIEDVVSYAELKQHDRILEVGCGTGQATKGFAKRNVSIVAIGPRTGNVARRTRKLGGLQQC
jgi:ubiquinone/menaquinone biosynthesis C-methylase UbiE